jgi:hypothetical protein
MVFGIVTMMIFCLACFCFCLCFGFMPVILQTMLQPFFYFERRFSLELLKQLGFPPPVLVSEPAQA